jgi:MoxR-like ATPase
MAKLTQEVRVHPEIAKYLVNLAEATRQHPALALGMSPRATLGWLRAARALAALNGRGFVIPDDLKALAQPVLGHRLMLTPEAQLQGRSSSEAVDDILRTVPAPAWDGR